jgi:tRNA(adenine34) deaminase
MVPYIFNSKRGEESMRNKSFIRGFYVFLICASLVLILHIIPAFSGPGEPTSINDLDAIEKQIKAFTPDPGYPDDRFAMITIMEAIAAAREKNGGIGACLVREKDGMIIERGHNRQYDPYFRSDRHAEMDLLNRFENRLRIKIDRNGKSGNPRQCYKGLVLYSSVEPCPMCLTRIINTGIVKVYFVAPDETGGMANHIDSLPPFWRALTEDRVFLPANCSPLLKELSLSLFHRRDRSVPKK